MYAILLLITFSSVEADAQWWKSGKKADVEKRKVVIEDDEPDSFLNKLNYRDIKSRVEKAAYPQTFDVVAFAKQFDALSDEKEDVKKVEELTLRLYSADNETLARLYKYSRDLNENNSPIMDEMSNVFFRTVDKEFKENALMSVLDERKEAQVNMIAKKSFSNVIGTVLDYMECLVCCEKNSFPDENGFLFKPKTGNSIKTSKAEYSKWMSNQICGFVIYNFPFQFKKARFKVLSLKGRLLAFMNGTPRFRNLSPNGTEVHVAMIPTIITLGLKSLKTPPCQNDKLRSDLLELVQVKCK